MQPWPVPWSMRAESAELLAATQHECPKMEGPHIDGRWRSSGHRATL